jgi:hypothetical protein
METPNGLAEIISTFGDIHKYIDGTGVLMPSWTTDYLAVADLPFPIPLSWKKDVSVQHITCHRLMVKTFEQVFAEIQAQGLAHLITSFGGCFNFRQERTGHKLSTHCWGITVDLNPLENLQGTAGNMPQPIIDIFTKAGFEWGGTWSPEVRDPMHLQYATGY